MNAQNAYDTIKDRLHVDAGRFYGPADNLSLGAGLFYAGVRFPLFDPATNLFSTVAGHALVLTHECDIDPENGKPFSDDVLVCPVIDFVDFVQRFGDAYGDAQLTVFLSNLVSKRVSRLMYVPPIGGPLAFGGVLFFNRITFTKVSAFDLEGTSRICALSIYGLRQIDWFLENHLLRPKDESLPLTVQ